MSSFNQIVEIPYQKSSIIDILTWFMSNDYKLFEDYDYYSTIKPGNNHVYIFSFHDKKVATAFALTNWEQ
jgi:hypothetical protein